MYDQQFALEKDGTDLLFFDRWTLTPVELGTLTVQVGAPDAAVVTAAGVEVPHAGAEGDTVELRAFPGSYPATLDGAGAYEADDVVGIATGASSTGSPATLVATLTDSGQARHVPPSTRGSPRASPVPTSSPPAAASRSSTSRPATR